MLEEIVVSAARSDKQSYSSATGFRDQAQEPSFDEVKYEANMSVDFKIGS